MLDVEKSLAICEAATPDWYEDGLLFIGTDANGCGKGGFTLNGPKPGTRLPEYATDDDFEYTNAESSANVTFCVHARENFPEALRRLKRLRELLDHDSPFLFERSCVEVRSLLSLDGKDGAL